jgi:hypothetical protein
MIWVFWIVFYLVLAFGIALMLGKAFHFGKNPPTRE